MTPVMSAGAAEPPTTYSEQLPGPAGWKDYIGTYTLSASEVEGMYDNGKKVKTIANIISIALSKVSPGAAAGLAADANRDTAVWRAIEEAHYKGVGLRVVLTEADAVYGYPVDVHMYVPY